MIALQAQGLGKAYRIYSRPIDSLKELFLRRDYAETFWALRDLTFSVEKGSSLGIIGDNGAGKSTLLKLLTGALAPTAGTISRTGRTSALLTLGAGFHPDLTGTENIRIGCAVLGLSPDETEAIIPRIVEFSELAEFVERPVRTYSSGMYLRLGFSVTTAVNPEVLIVDEHLSVGDQHFRLKCKRRIMDLRADGCTIVLCSHDLHSVSEVCDQAIWLEHGRSRMYGESHQVVQAYQDAVRMRDAEAPLEKKGRRTPASNFLKEVSLSGDIVGNEIRTGGTLRLRIVVTLTEDAMRDGTNLAVLIVRDDGVRCYGSSTKVDCAPSCVYPIGGGDYGTTYVIESLPLLAGNYSFLVALQDFTTPHTYDWMPNAAPFTVVQDGRDAGVARILHRWERP